MGGEVGVQGESEGQVEGVGGRAQLPRPHFLSKLHAKRVLKHSSRPLAWPSPRPAFLLNTQPHSTHG